MLKNLFILAILAASINCQQRTVKGCLRWTKETKSCTACYRRQVSTGGCGPLLPVTDTCLVHTESIGQQLKCELCRKGYGLTKQGGCAPLNIFNCVSGLFVTPTKKGCLYCGNGEYPSQDGSVCAPSTTPTPNCLWGTAGHLKPFCARCVPNYVANEKNQCERQVPSTQGCLRIFSGECYACDVFAGYSMQKNGSCKFVQQ